MACFLDSAEAKVAHGACSESLQGDTEKGSLSP